MSGKGSLKTVVGTAVFLLAACNAPGTINTVSPHESSCLEAVAEATDNDDVGTLEVIPTEAGVTVMVQVGEAEAPWVCMAGEDGFAQKVYYSAEG